MGEKMQILFEKPAIDMIDTLPIGNGRIGALIYGELMREQVVLNESSMWSGSPEETDREQAANYLPQIRELLQKGKNYEAEQVFKKHFTCTGKGTNYAHGSTVPFGCYQMLGRMYLSYFQAVSSGRIGCDCVKDYKRVLDLDTGIVTVSFKLSDIVYQREWIASKEQESIYLHLTASKKQMIHLSIGLDRDECFDVFSTGEKEIIMKGQLADGYDTEKGIHYICGVKAITKGGNVYTKGTRLYIEDADEAVVLIAAHTDLSGFMGKKKIEIEKQIKTELENASKKSWEEVKKEHITSYQKQYKKMQIQLGEKTELENLPTKERILRFINGEEDLELISLYVQYARYLLISCSQQDSFPANLQGIWTDEIQTPWNGDWHLNAQQMIYWLAEKANLSECHIPYLNLTKELVIPGRKTAKAYYGRKGWLAHTCTNPWGFTSPCEDAAWGSTTGSPAWLCHHLWEHYLYTLDDTYLEEIYPVMKEAMQFYLEMLVEEKEHKYLVTSPSSSPENLFLDEKGRKCGLCEGPAYDRELIKALASYCIEAQYILKNDISFQQMLESIQERFAPIQIGNDGRIMEWGEEYREAMPYHRHLSHLWGVYPGSLISKEDTPKLAKAAIKSLKGRGRTTVGWAIAYRMCLWARLRNGEEAYSYIRDMFRYATGYNLFNLAYHCDETTLYPELPDIEKCRYPFQIDGNQGNGAGILLMLLDDKAAVTSYGEIEIDIILLPALPSAFSSGWVKGICAKGGILVDIEWKNGVLVNAFFTGKEGQKAVVYYKKEEKEIVFEKEIVSFY